MGVLNNISIVVSIIITIYLSYKWSKDKYKKYLLVIVAIFLQLLYRSIEYIYYSSFFHSVLTSRIFVPVVIVVENLSLIGIFIGISYLLATQCVKLIKRRRQAGYVSLVIIGIIMGLCVPKVVFYTSEYRLYSWIPDYSPVGEQFKGGSIIGLSIIVFIVNLILKMKDCEVKSKRWVILISLALSLFTGICIQYFDVGIFPDILMRIFFG